MGGKKFSRVNRSGNKMSRLDRFLVTEAAVDRSPNLICMALERKYSDHCPLILKDERNDYGPNSFKIFNSWMEIDGFDEMVKNSCMEYQPMEGDSKCVVLKNKLKFVKSKIKVWHLKRGMTKLVNMLELDAIELKDNAQKSKKKWIKEGDENTKLFHGMLKRKRSQKNITGVVIDGEWVTNPQFVKEAFREYYANKFKSFSGIRPSNKSQRYKSLSNTQVEMLEKSFSNQEIRDAVWACGSDKAPGPDGLVKVVGSIVSLEQSAFIKGRQITDGALMVNEIVTWAKKYKKKMMMFKVDFEKAYDSLSWDYLDCMFEYMGFGDTWRKWIHRCLVSARASVLLNGSPTKEFQLHRDLRQGDPLSSFLFILAMEGLHILIEDAVQYSRFKGVQVGNSLIIMSHLFYADDAIFMENDVQDLARCTGYGADSIPFMYLGLHVGERMYWVNSWTPLMVKFKKRLANYKSKLMSIGGRLTLGIDDNEKKIQWAKWDSILNSKEKGGLDVGSLWAFNKALLFKWRWRFLNGNDMPWVKLIKSCHGTEGGFLDGGTTPPKSGCGDGTLEATYPRLVTLASNRNAFVSDYWSMHGWNISWRRDIRGGVEQSQYDQLMACLQVIHINLEQDVWQWEFDNEETFTVRSVRKSLDVKRFPGHAWATRWCNIIPIKNLNETALKGAIAIPAEFVRRHKLYNHADSNNSTKFTLKCFDPPFEKEMVLRNRKRIKKIDDHVVMKGEWKD
ncbi:RNA-directed DNA polymerase, eukaryota, reverse transcriptase zinc-binding domain protein [Tanacetum coccineum]